MQHKPTQLHMILLQTPSDRLRALLGLRLLDVSLRETLQDDLHFVPAESEQLRYKQTPSEVK